MWNEGGYGKAGDVESGSSRPLYPMMLESAELRWGFIRKIYSIVAIQLILTTANGAVVVSVHPIKVFFCNHLGWLDPSIVLIITPFIVLCPLYYYAQKHPVNYILLGIFIVALVFTVGLTCAYTNNDKSFFGALRLTISPLTYKESYLESVILAAVVVVSLTLYTFWAAKRGHDFNFLGPFLFGAVMVLVLFAIVQMFFPLGKVSVMIYGCQASIIFCAYIIYDTDNLIKRYTYDNYIWAAVALYLVIINLFLLLLKCFRAVHS